MNDHFRRSRREVRLEAAERIVEKEDAPVSYTHLRAHETVLDLVFRLLLEKKTHKKKKNDAYH